MKRVWKQCLNVALAHLLVFDEVEKMDEIKDNIVELAKTIQLLEQDDVEQLLNNKSKEQSSKDIIKEE